MDFLFIYITILVLLETYRVFGKKWNTKQVYEQGIKEVALSVVRGINCEYSSFSIIPDCVDMYIVVLALRDFSFSLVKLKHNLS